METISDFLKDLKDRLSNPFISSFVISWLLTNWRITLSLIFYNQDELILDDYTSFTDLILRNSGWINMLFIPLGFSLLYTFGFPYLKAYIKLKHAEIISTNDTKILMATSAGRIPTFRFIELRDEYITALGKLTALTEAESATRTENQRLLSEIATVNSDFEKERREHNGLINKFHNQAEVSSPKSLDGRWFVTRKAKGLVSEKFVLDISQGLITEVKHLTEAHYKVREYIMDAIRLRLALHITKLEDGFDTQPESIFLAVSSDFAHMTVTRSEKYDEFTLSRFEEGWEDTKS